MKKTIFGFMAFCLGFVFVLAACKGNSDLPIVNKGFSPLSDGWTQFYTNDPAQYGWAYGLIFDSNINITDTYQIECKKISGSAGAGYGMIFGLSNDAKNKYYRVLISAYGGYRVDKYDGTKAENLRWTMIKDWTNDATDNVIPGYNKTNTIKVTHAGNQYTLFLNGNQSFHFTDTDNFGSRVGIYAVISTSANESFPNIPVDIRYRQTAVTP
jgi:hypothetical protein